ncbi:MAG TPA: LptA/OstA family protein [Oculatellaceae cyanobacterium]|jgi:lipopolysaccharide export system protein LptA
MSAGGMILDFNRFGKLSLIVLSQSSSFKPVQTMISSYKLIDSLKRRLGLAIIAPLVVAGALAPLQLQNAQAQTSQDNRPLSVRADVQEYNSKTGVVTARGNVQVLYPSRQIQGTAAQAQYFSRERRIVMSGNVYILQQGNSLRGETITYLIDEGRFVALPKSNKQVESVYIVSEPNNSQP